MSPASLEKIGCCWITLQIGGQLHWNNNFSDSAFLPLMCSPHYRYWMVTRLAQTRNQLFIISYPLKWVKKLMCVDNDVVVLGFCTPNEVFGSPIGFLVAFLAFKQARKQYVTMAQALSNLFIVIVHLLDLNWAGLTIKGWTSSSARAMNRNTRSSAIITGQLRGCWDDSLHLPGELTLLRRFSPHHGCVSHIPIFLSSSS